MSLQHQCTEGQHNYSISCNVKEWDQRTLSNDLNVSNLN